MSRVQPISFGGAANVSLDHYYDLLKAQIGQLGSREFLQLKLVADPLDLSESCPYWSLYNLLNRSDVAVEPSPVPDEVVTGAERLHQTYARFLQRLRSYVVRKELSAEDQQRHADIEIGLDRLRRKLADLVLAEVADWASYCAATGADRGDRNAYVQWRAFAGRQRDIEEIHRAMRASWFDLKTILDRQYSSPEDREVIDAEFDYENPQMRLRYPLYPDYEYDDQDRFSLTYLAGLPLGSTALFDDRRVMAFGVSLKELLTAQAGAFSAQLDRRTAESSSIRTDWNASARVGWGFLGARASVSEAKKVEQEFRTATAITLSAKATLKVQIVNPGWFKPTLFEHGYVRENIRDFGEFFGTDGTLRYYPTHLVAVRGFSVSFTNVQKWSYDYERRFGAAAGGGFRAFGINFGGSAGYGRHVQNHRVDRSGTELIFSDDPSTLRFVGYVVREVPAADEEILVGKLRSLPTFRSERSEVLP